MRVHLAGAAMHRDRYSQDAPRIAMQAVIAERWRYSLISFATPADIRPWLRTWRSIEQPALIVDSGAYTAHTLGLKVSLRQYASFVRAFPELYPEPTELYFMTLDVIGNQAETWRNWRQLAAWGIDTMPVITPSATARDIAQALDAAPYIAVGGLVRNRDPDALLRPLFSEALRRWRETGVMPKVHLLGVNREPLLLRYPGFSCDASSWLSIFRYGTTTNVGVKGMRAYHETAAATAVVRLEVRRELRRLRAIEAKVTATWARRGISWEDEDGTPHGAGDSVDAEHVEPEPPE